MAEVTAGMFTDLVKELGHMSKIDGLAAMSGRDMWGNDFTVLPEELPDYIANTQRVLNSTKDSKGNVVGLPIDCMDHDHMGGAGWIQSLELAEGRDVIIFGVEWTESGLEMVGNNESRYFSPTFDTENKQILGGSLTNWPGSRKPNGQYLLRPVELSKSRSIAGITNTKENQMTVETVPEVKPSWFAAFETKLAELTASFNPKKPDQKPEPTAQTVRELMDSPEAIREMARRAEEIAANKNALYARQQHVIQLASELVGGSTSRPFGLAGIGSDEIVELLMGLPMPQSLAVEKVICKIADSMAQVNFAELGSAGSGYSRKPRVPAEYRSAVQVWVNEGRELSAWFVKVGADLGLDKAENYNLTEFVKEA